MGPSPVPTQTVRSSLCVQVPVPVLSGSRESLTRAKDQVLLQLGVSRLFSGHYHTNSTKFFLPPHSDV